MTQIYKITCELTIPVGDIPVPKEMAEFFTLMLQRMFKGQEQGQRLKVINVMRVG